MLSKFIIDAYGPLIEVGLWIFLIIAVAIGYAANGFTGAIFGLFAWVSASIFFVGPVLLLLDLRDKVERIENVAQESRTKD